MTERLKIPFEPIGSLNILGGFSIIYIYTLAQKKDAMITGIFKIR